MTGRFSRTATAALCALLLAGCAGSPQAGTSTVPSANTAVQQEVVPQRGGDLFIAVPAGLESLDPLDASSEDLVNLYTLMYEAPFEYDDTGRLHNVLVESWDASEDGKTYSFTFRDDVYFSDGTPMTVNDVYESAVRAWHTQAEPEPTAEPTPEAADGEETPSQELSVAPASSYSTRFAEYGKGIKDIRVQDGVLVIETDERDNNVMRFMTFPVTKNGAGSLAPGTGPYVVSDPFTPGEQIELEVNTSWWGDGPYIERIVAVPVEAQRDKIQMQQTSLIDFLTTDALNAGNYALKGQTKVIDYMTDYLDCLVPNITVPGLSNPEVRRAISYAIDRREILSTVLLNHGVPSNLPIAPDSFVMDARFRSNQRDTDAALTLLGQAGYRTEELGNGRTLELSLIVPDSIGATYKKEAARAIRKQLADVFIDVTVEELSDAEYERRLISGDYDLAYCSYYLSTIPDLSFMLQVNGSGNFNGFSDTQVDLAIQDCAMALTEQEYVDAYARLQELLNVHMPVIGLYFRMHSIVCDEGIGGIGTVREETIFDDMPSWYTMYTTRMAEPQTSPSSSSAPDRRQTEPGTLDPQPDMASQSSSDGGD